ncbi:MAG: hypothetical protein KF872_02570 [Chitinophagales bacterium]|nr:hypothetical protein [Chitinophagales bacterium]
MNLNLKKIAPWLLLGYTFLLCFIVSKLPIDSSLLGDLVLDIFPRFMCGVGLFLIAGALFFEHKYQSWISKEWMLLNVFVLVSFSMLYALFHSSNVGLNGLVGDAYFSAAMVTKYKYFNTLTDFNYFGLSSSYPALYHFIVGKMAAALGMDSCKAVQLGYYFIYCVVSIPLFLVLRQSVGALPAVGFVFFIFLNFPVDNLFKPYEFITSVLFLAWWLVFIEKKDAFSWLSVLVGGIIGAAIFASYYYWFFVAAVYLFVSFLWELKQNGIQQFWKSRKQTFFVLLCAAVFSSFYWMPLMMDFLKYGVVSLQNMWLSGDMVRYSFLDQKPPLVQLVMLSGVLFIFIFRNDTVMAVLLKLLAVMAFWFTLGFFTLYLKKPLVANKLHYLIDATCALGFFYGIFSCIKWNGTVAKQLPLVVFLLLLLLGCNSFLELRYHSYYQAMSQYTAFTLQENKAAVLPFKNKVMISDRQYINALVPVHYFLNNNAHFSHPASRFHQRIDFLKDLEQIQNPAVLAWFLAYNKFNKVDLLFFENLPSLSIYDDDFPRGHKLVSINFSPMLLQSEFVKPFATLPNTAGTVFELLPPPFELKKSFNSFELDLVKKYTL